jgi:cytidine deaminase
MSDTEQTTAMAIKAMDNSCCKNSKYKVGAALQTSSGKIFTGVNVESDSYGLTVCAERVALFKALSEGERHFSRLACATKDGGISCGACRQLLREYCPADMPCVFVKGSGEIMRDTTVGVMLPDPFVLE